MPLQRRIPKFGFRSRIGLVTAEVRLGELAKVGGDVVDMTSLRTARLMQSNIKRARIFLSGTIDRAVTVRGIAVTKGARAAIEAQGGSIEESAATSTVTGPSNTDTVPPKDSGQAHVADPEADDDAPGTDEVAKGAGEDEKED